MTGFVPTNYLGILIKLSMYCSIKQKVRNVKIKIENSLKFLGVMIDDNMTWKTHVELVEKRISKSVGILFKVSRSLNSKSL